MGKIKLDKLDINLNMIFYDPKKDKWRCICGKEFTFQADAVTHLSKDHSKRNCEGR